MTAAMDFMNLSIVIAFAVVALAQVMSMVRLVLGPSVGDRILALDTMVVNAIGLLKFNDSMARMHAPTKVGTVGIGALLLAAIIHSYAFDYGSFHELLIMAFLFVTAPISAKFIAKVNIHKGSCVTPPSPPRDDNWSTLQVPEADRELAVPEGDQAVTGASSK